MPSRINISPAAAVTAVILTSGLGFSLAANLPGHLSYDSVVQLLEGRQAAYANWHPPVMSWLLGIFDDILPGASLFVAFNSLLLFGSLLSLLLLPCRTSWAAVAAALLCVVSPQFFLYPGIVWKDVLFAALAAAAFVSLAHAAAHWGNTRMRFGLAVFSCLCLVVAALARQSGGAIVPVAAIAWGWVATRHSSLRKGIIQGVAFFASIAIAALGARAALETRVQGEEGPATQIELLQTYDIIGALKADQNYALDSISQNDPNLARQMRTEGTRLYTPQRNDTLGNSQTLQTARDNADPDLISAQWWDLVSHRPLLYLKVRWDAFRWVFFTPDLSACVPYVVGVDGPPEVLRTLGITPRMDARDDALDNYSATFIGTPILSHAAMALLAVCELALLLRRRRDADIAVAAMLGAALVFTLTFLPISIACDYRYLYFLDISAMVALFYLALGVDVQRLGRGPKVRSAAITP